MPTTAPIRVIFCITELDPGGAERALTQLVLGLDRDEWHASVICLGPRGYFADVLEQAGIAVVCLNASGIKSIPRVIRRLAQEFRKQKPALVQTFLFHANILGRIAARMAGVPVVVSGIRVAERRNRWHGWIDRWTNSLVKTNVCVSRGVATFAQRQTGLCAKKLVIIPNAVDFERFAHAKPLDRRSLNIPEDSIVCISIGRLEHQKGFDILLDAIKQVAPLPANIHFLIVGDGPDRDRLRACIVDAELEGQIQLLGRREDIPELLATATALILPSRWEGMPNVALEAMAAGRPIIATDVEGVPELIEDQSNGIIVPVESPELLSAAIRFLIDHPEFADEAGKRSQQIIVKEFMPQNITRAYAQLYKSLLNG